MPAGRLENISKNEARLQAANQLQTQPRRNRRSFFHIFFKSGLPALLSVVCHCPDGKEGSPIYITHMGKGAASLSPAKTIPNFISGPSPFLTPFSCFQNK